MPAANSLTLLEEWQVLDFLVALVEKSLVVFDENGDNGDNGGQNQTGRYRFLETTRQYGAERLAQQETGEADALRRRHRAYYLRLAENAAPHLHGPQAAVFIAAIASDHGNFRVALNGFADAAPTNTTALHNGATLCGDLFEFWSLRGYFGEGRDFCQTFLDGDNRAGRVLPPSLRAQLLRACGSFWGYLNEFVPTEACLTEALLLDRAAQNHTGISESLVSLGIITKHKVNPQAARALFDEGLTEARWGGDGRAIAVALTNVAHLSPSKAEQALLHEECLAIFRRMGDAWGVAQSLGNLGWLKQAEGDEEGAAGYYDECRTLRESLGDKHGLGWLMRGIAQSALARGDREAALAAYHKAIEVFRSISNRQGMAWMQYYRALMPVADGVWPDGEDETALNALRDALRNFVAIKEPGSIRYVLEGFGFRFALTQPEKAALMWGAGRRLRDELDAPEDVPEAVLLQARQIVRDALGDEAAWNDAYERGRAMETSEAVELALASDTP